MDEYILIVDDDRDIRNLLGIYLENEGLPFIKCDSALNALEVLRNYKVGLILLDIMMPGIDGIDACIKIRESNKMPIIFMSAKVEDIDIIQGLMAGGDDYITKPFNPVQVIARVKAQLRRYKQYNTSNNSVDTLQYEELCLNTKNHQVFKNAREIRLTPKEYEILELLVRNKGLVLSIGQIYENVWHEEFFHSESTVMMHIANLRSKLADDSSENKYIQTVWGQGYKI